MDRDKAVEVALMTLAFHRKTPRNLVLNLLWQRAQEAAEAPLLKEIEEIRRIAERASEDADLFKAQLARAQEAEREAMALEACGLCRKRGKAEHRIGGLSRELCWWHSMEEIHGRPYDARCAAYQIRNRSARASEEPESVVERTEGR